MRAVRGNDIAMIFQEPMTSLNPLHSIEKQIGEVLELHQGRRAGRLRERFCGCWSVSESRMPSTGLAPYRMNCPAGSDSAS